MNQRCIRCTDSACTHGCHKNRAEVGLPKQSWLSRHGFDSDTAIVIGVFGIAEMIIYVIGVSWMIGKLGDWLFAELSFGCGIPNDLISTAVCNKILSMGSNGYMKMDLGTNVEVKVLRGAVFWGAQILLLAVIAYNIPHLVWLWRLL
jgi:hypothetical protein